MVTISTSKNKIFLSPIQTWSAN